MKKIIVSACLLGTPCRYDGKSVPCDNVTALRKKYTLIPVCPECMGGLQTPRAPSEIVSGKVINNIGEDNTAQFLKGANIALDTAKRNGCTVAILKSRSPSCGKGRVYDGTFSGTVTDGDGITACLLSENGIKVYTENETDEIK